MAQNIEISFQKNSCPEIGHFVPGASLSRPGLPDSVEPKKPNALSKKAKKSQTPKLRQGTGP